MHFVFGPEPAKIADSGISNWGVIWGHVNSKKTAKILLGVRFISKKGFRPYIEGRQISITIKGWMPRIKFDHWKFGKK